MFWAEFANSISFDLTDIYECLYVNVFNIKGSEVAILRKSLCYNYPIFYYRVACRNGYSQNFVPTSFITLVGFSQAF